MASSSVIKQINGRNNRQLSSMTAMIAAIITLRKKLRTATADTNASQPERHESADEYLVADPSAVSDHGVEFPQKFSCVE